MAKIPIISIILRKPQRRISANITHIFEGSGGFAGVPNKLVSCLGGSFSINQPHHNRDQSSTFMLDNKLTHDP